MGFAPPPVAGGHPAEGCPPSFQGEKRPFGCVQSRVVTSPNRSLINTEQVAQFSFRPKKVLQGICSSFSRKREQLLSLQSAACNRLRSCSSPPDSRIRPPRSPARFCGRLPPPQSGLAPFPSATLRCGPERFQPRHSCGGFEHHRARRHLHRLVGAKLPPICRSTSRVCAKSWRE